MTMRVVVVDDEPLALSLMTSLLDEIEDIEIVARCRNGREVIAAVQEHAPDILFLDIQMPEMNGFDVVAAIQDDIMPLVVFTTAYAEYAVDAFKVQALDYILKPLKESDLEKSVERARSALATKERSQDKASLLMALQDISTRVPQEPKQRDSSLVLKDSDRIAVMKSEDIDWLEAAGDYVCVHSQGKTRITRTTLKSVEGRLDKEIFHRIHRSTIINMSRVKEIIPAQKGEAFAIMSDGKQLKVSRSYSADFKARFTAV